MWHNRDIKTIITELKSDVKNGLDNSEVLKRQEKYGYNEIISKKKKSLFVKFLEQFKNFMIIILIISSIVSGIIGVIENEGITDSIIILAIVVLNAIIGVVQESRAEKSLEALKKLTSHSVKVIRNGSLLEINSKELVIGDIVHLETGDFVPADLRIIESVNLKSQEASLTGESVPVTKNSDVIKEKNTPIGDKLNMLFSSSLITYGRGSGVVVEVGMNTEVGKIADLINSVEDSKTPLQEKLDKLGKTLGIVAIIICVIMFAIGILYNKEPLHMFMSAVSLAVAAIPEGLPAVFTIVLALGVSRMVKKNAIVKKLPAVETLGSTEIICSDKTGTLTQNKMTVKKIFCDNKLVNVDNIDKLTNLDLLVHTSMLCNDTKITSDGLIGDPTETALIDMAFKLKYNKDILNSVRCFEIPFDSKRKLMTTVNKVDDKYIVFTKGGIDELLNVSTSYKIDDEVNNNIEEYKNIILKNNKEMTTNALRVLGFSYKIFDELPNKKDLEDIEKDLTFIGMVGLIDPPRDEVKLSVKKCVEAGIKTVMITGDHKDTAVAIALELGIIKDKSEAITGLELDKLSDKELKNKVKNYSVYARVAPEHKVRIVDAWQKNGKIVAMTGDGVNDAPSLKKANIGCAMGIVGTDVSKEAASVILTDDNFATIVDAVEEGRRIYDNILKAIQFLLSSNIGEVVVLVLSILFAPLISKTFGVEIGLIEALLPIHILWVNLVTDSLPALALAVDPAVDGIMGRKPIKNKNSQIFNKGMTYRVIYQGTMIGLLTLIAFLIGLSTDTDPANKLKIGQTMAFFTLALSELVHVFNVRNNNKSIFKTKIFNNKQLIGATLVSASLMFIILFTEKLRNIFGIVMLPKQHVVVLIILVISPLIIVEIMKLFKINTFKEENK